MSDRVCGRCTDVVGREPALVGPGRELCPQCVAEIQEYNATHWGGEG
ncbi:hypothetical protein [Nocardia tengchongensis]